MTLPRIIVTSGEPAGIGPELCVALAARPLPARLIVAGNRELLAERAHLSNTPVTLEAHAGGDIPPHRPGRLLVADHALGARSRPGHLDRANAGYVLALLEHAAGGCLQGDYDAMVTAPLHKGVINDAGVTFIGHTEYLADATGCPQPVMLLVGGSMRVALATTHLPLSRVSTAITFDSLCAVIRALDQGLCRWFVGRRPRIVVCGLNPHAGEGGHLGQEEIEVIGPALEALRAEGLDLNGPVPADTAFTPALLATADAVLAMYHDQGLPVLKHASFGKAVNVTLGLPIVRTSVDHGTALDLAGTGRANSGSLEAAVDLAIDIANRCGARA
ncbi:MAG: 4-hydroxythreonine-4-phosphate dehydrogenase PdxA [Gammaproteobacteria bacterium]